jgi:hypothetical protein
VYRYFLFERKGIQDHTYLCPSKEKEHVHFERICVFVQFHLQVIHATQAHVLSMRTVKCWQDEQCVHVWKVLKVTLQPTVILNA